MKSIPKILLLAATFSCNQGGKIEHVKKTSASEGHVHAQTTSPNPPYQPGNTPYPSPSYTPMPTGHVHPK